jgi:hypothetical protein
MNQIATTKEQSERLIKLGVPKETADMHYWLNHDNQWNLCLGNGANFQVNRNRLVEAWSLPALIGLLPKRISINTYLDSDRGEIDEDYELCFDYRRDGTVSYGYGDCYYNHAANIFDATINLIEWVIDCGTELNNFGK